jgi:hypothetical protein
MVKIVDLEYTSLLHSFGILLLIVLVLVLIYYVCRFFDQGVDELPTFLQPNEKNPLVNQIKGEFDYGIDYIIASKIPDPHLDEYDKERDEEDEHTSSPKEASSPAEEAPTMSPSGTPEKEQASIMSPSVTPEKEEAPIPDTSSCPTLLMKKDGKLMLYHENKPEIKGKNPIFFDTLDDYTYYAQVQRKQTGIPCPILYLKEDDNQTYKIEEPEPIVEEEKTEEEEKPQRGSLDHLDLSNINTISDYFQQRQPVKMVQQARVPVRPITPYRPCPLVQYPLAPPANLALRNVPQMPLQKKPQQPMVPYIDANRDLNPRGYYGFDPSDQYIGKYTVLDKIHDSTKNMYPSGLSANAMDSNWGGAVFTTSKIKEGDYALDNVIMESPETIQKQEELINQQQQLTGPKTADAMDPNWGGTIYSQQQVASGQYAGDDVFMTPA